MHPLYFNLNKNLMFILTNVKKILCFYRRQIKVEKGVKSSSC